MRVAAMAVIPIVMAGLSIVICQAFGPRWLADRSDPDYQYLLSSLNIVEGHSPRHTDHPGTPLQIIGAGVLIARHAIVGNGALRDEALDKPERALQTISTVLMVLNVGALTWFGAAARRFSGSTACALVAQALPVLSITALKSIHRVAPEPLLLTVTYVLGAAVLRAIARPGPIGTRFAVVSGVVTALGLVTKVTFAPFLVVPAGLLWERGRRGWRMRAFFLTAFMFSLFMFLLPILSQVWRVLDWLWVVMTAGGDYGARGHPLTVDLHKYIGNLGRMLCAEPATVAVVGVGLVMLGAVIVRRSWKNLDYRGRYAASALAAVTVAQVLQCVLVAKRPEPRYLMPAIGLSGLNACLILALARALWPRRGAPVAALLAAVGVAAAGIFVGREFQRVVTWYRKETASRQAVMEAGEQAVREGGVLILSYGSSSPAYALFFGDDWSGFRQTDAIAQRYPNRLQYDIWAKTYRLGRQPISKDQMAALAGEGRLYFQGVPSSRQPGFEYQPMTSPDAWITEALYKVSLPAHP